MATTIGVELEMTFPEGEATYDLESSIAPYHGEYRHAAGMPSGWMAQHDSSIQATRPFRFTCELVSPVMRWPQALDAVRWVIERCNRLGARTNFSCGLHVHLGAYNLDDDDVTRLVALTKRYEFALYGSAGSSIVARMASSHGQHYCKPSTFGINEHDRYQGLNLTGLSGDTRQHTVEYRVFQCSMRAERVLGPMCLAMGLYDLACGGDSESLGLNREVTRITDPVEAMAELLPVTDASEEVKATLMRQARKAKWRMDLV